MRLCVSFEKTHNRMNVPYMTTISDERLNNVKTRRTRKSSQVKGRQAFATIVGNKYSLLKLGRERAVFRYRRPVVS